MKEVPYILGISQGVVKEMSGSSHTPACCLSKLRSSLEAGKKQPRVWLQYVSGVKEMLLCSSFRVPLFLLWSLYGGLEMACNGFKVGSRMVRRSCGDICYYHT